jgi:hypothetical protein
MQRALSSYTSGQDQSDFTQISFSDLSAGEAAHPFQRDGGDKRSGSRRRVLLTALIVNREFNATFRCQVRDVSDQGARLNIPESFLVPVGFWLIAVSSGLAYGAKLAWRRYPNVGVSLGEPVDLNEPISRLGRQLRSLWIGSVS